MNITATVEFPNWEDQGDGLFDDVIRQAVDELIKEKSGALNAAIDAEFAARISTMFNDYLESEVQPTDKHGKSKGPRQKVSDLLLQDIDVWFEEIVDSKGRSKSDPNYYTHSFNRGRSRFDHMVSNVLSSEKYDMRFETRVKEAMKEIKANFDGQITDVIKASLKNLVK